MSGGQQFSKDDIIIESESNQSESSFSYGIKEQNISASRPEYFEKAMSVIKHSAELIENQLKQTDVDEAEVTFGLKSLGEGFLYVTQGTEKANFVIKLKWNSIKQK